MKVTQVLSALTAGAAFAVVIGVGSLSGISRAQADDDEAYREQSRIRRGFEIAPVPLNLRHKDPELVGLGSYLVNAVASCNMCHSGGTATNSHQVEIPTSRVVSRPLSIRPHTWAAAESSRLRSLGLHLPLRPGI
jgi:hypothetical protein